MNWTPFERATVTRAHAQIHAIANKFDLPGKDEIWINNLYQVAVFRDGDWIHLSIKRQDRSATHDWRHLQRIKNEIVGPENEAVELFPAESRLVDAANQFHLWVLADPQARFPIGFGDRWVSDTNEFGSIQRPFPPDARPKDCETMAQYAARHKIELPTT